MKNANKLPAIVMSIAVALAILTGSIAVPIIIRPFYYAQIDPLELERSSGLSREEIIEAYDEVLDYCIGASDEFSAGGDCRFRNREARTLPTAAASSFSTFWLFFRQYGRYSAAEALSAASRNPASARPRCCLLGRSRDRRGATRNRSGSRNEF